jgi:phosphoketolase
MNSWKASLWVMEILSEHSLEGCLLTGRHGLFASYEAFIEEKDAAGRV